ncbi:MAG TPA: YraN family protein [Gaiellaceae bacterium]
MRARTYRHPSERRAARWYRLRGYRILDHNVWLAGAELDLVVRRGRTVAFVEVKSKSGDGFGTPGEMVTPAKMERLRRAALAWLRVHPGLDPRFDVVAEDRGRLEVVQDAF